MLKKIETPCAYDIELVRGTRSSLETWVKVKKIMDKKLILSISDTTKKNIKKR